MRKQRRSTTKTAHRPRTSKQFRGNAWVLPSAAVAKTTYQTLLPQLLDRPPQDWSLVSGFFQHRPVLVFVWTLEVAPRLVATVHRTILTAGGQELAAEAKDTLVAQMLARRVGLQAKEGPFDTLTAHHPKGKPVWDLE